MGTPTRVEANLATELRKALERDEIVPYFQPQVKLRTGRLLGFEVLARWRHRSLGMVPPTTFIPVAESTGLIGILTEKVVNRACTAAAAWTEHLTLSVNVGPLQLRDHALPERLRAAAEQTGFPLNRLVLEITETALVSNIEQARTVMAEFKALGIQLAIDDFGTGFSCLRLLQTLPFDKLNVDASFVHPMTYQRESRKIVAAIIELGHSLGLSTVAEGVETQQQADMLVCLGCDVGQGWLFGRAAPAEEIAASLEAGRWDRPLDRQMTRIAMDVALHLEAMPSQRLAHLQALYNGAPVGLAYLDRNLRYVSLNKRLAEIHDRPIAAHIGQSVADVQPVLIRQAEPHLSRALRGEPVTDVAVRLPAREQGKPDVLFAASYHPVRDEAGEIVGVSVAVIETTERIRKGPPVGHAPDCTAAIQPSTTTTRLTPRQREVLKLAGEGHSVKEIARRLDLSVSTVKLHLARAYAVLGARNRIEALRRAGLTSL
ncbi:MAG: EAL domain-containing protein [Rhodopila sp.]|nr:EAL domain-containing protein [Rhodopila sp.]